MPSQRLELETLERGGSGPGMLNISWLDVTLPGDKQEAEEGSSLAHSLF